MFPLYWLALQFKRFRFGKFSPEYYYAEKSLQEKYSWYPRHNSDSKYYDLVMDLVRGITPGTFIPMHTPSAIRFGNIAFGSSIRDIIRRKGKPDYHAFIPIGLNNLGIFSYRSHYLSHRIRTVYYFLDDKLFSGEYVFNPRSSNIKRHLRDDLQDKYKIDPPDDFTRTLVITNGKGETTLTVCNSGFAITFQYLSLSSPVKLEEIRDTLRAGARA